MGVCAHGRLYMQTPYIYIIYTAKMLWKKGTHRSQITGTPGYTGDAWCYTAPGVITTIIYTGDDASDSAWSIWQHSAFYTQNFEHVKHWNLLQFLAEQASFACDRVAAEDVNSQFYHSFCRSTMRKDFCPWMVTCNDSTIVAELDPQFRAKRWPVVVPRLHRPLPKERWSKWWRRRKREMREAQRRRDEGDIRREKEYLRIV